MNREFAVASPKLGHSTEGDLPDKSDFFSRNAETRAEIVEGLRGCSPTAPSGNA